MISGEGFEKIKSELEKTLDDVLQNSSELGQARDVKTVIDWFRKGKQAIDPGKILGMLSKNIVSNVFEKLPTELSDTLEDTLQDSSIQKNHGGRSITTFLPGFQTLEDIVLVANGSLDLGKVTLGLFQDIGITLDQVRVLMVEGSKRYEIGKIGFSVNLYLFSKMMIGTKRKKIAQKEFELRDIVLSVV